MSAFTKSGQAARQVSAAVGQELPPTCRHPLNEPQADLLTSQKNGSGPCATPVTFLRQA
jgi:hypothetical protein